MNPQFLRGVVTASLAFVSGIPCATGHDLASGEEHLHYDRSIKPPEILLVQATAGQSPARTNARPMQALLFEAFAPRVKVRWDERTLFVESNGMPAHAMMVGITAWQQQVPLPQDYTGANAWQFPRTPVPSKTPVSIKGRFLRGAIALAVNGIPIFNPQNNRGEVSAEIGELDEWGGHCGRADDYHYHAAPLHLQSVVGQGRPIAYALDGYPIYGLAEPNGTAPAGLDAFNGHTTAGLGYHYHASSKYPYVNGGFHGEVVERDGQVDPQPRANPIREALPPLRGAKITGFTASPDAKTYALQYWLNGKTAAVNYASSGEAGWKFQYVNADGTTREETYRPGERRGGGGRKEGSREGDRPPRDSINAAAAPTPTPKQAGAFSLRSAAVADGGPLPVEYTGDGPGSTLPLEWTGAPAGTKSYALIMHHLDREGKTKWYWTLYNIPAAVTDLKKNTAGVGTLGASFKGQAGYEPPNSQGPGAKTYILTLYALSAPPPIRSMGTPVTGDVLSAAIKDLVLASSDLNVIYSRGGATGSQGPTGEKPAPRNGNGTAPPTTAPRESAGIPSSNPSADAGQSRPGQPKAGDGLVKATTGDTMKAAVYADNWFALYINGRLAVVDPVAFLPHNVVSVDLLPEYPMTIAVIAHDNADPKTGLEYGNHIGDAGFILKFADGTVTDGTWKAKSIERGPIGGNITHPRVKTETRPAGWFLPEFDDSQWANASVFTEQRVNPKAPYFEHDFKGAQFIWSQDLALDNTVLFRKRIEKPGWTPRWTAQPAGPLPQP